MVMDARRRLTWRPSPGVAGEAVYRSPSMMSGYYRDEAATREAFRYGWFHSGDSCAYDSEGLRIMLDRYKDIIKTGGENVSSLRVEAVLAQHPDVDKVGGHRSAARALGRGGHGRRRPRPGREPSPEDIIKFCQADPRRVRGAQGRHLHRQPSRRPSAARSSSTSCASGTPATTPRGPGESSANAASKSASRSVERCGGGAWFLMLRQAEGVQRDQDAAGEGDRHDHDR